MTSVYIVWYAISILTIWICYVFRGVSAKDYKYNKSLQIKRYCAIIWCYLVILLQGCIIGTGKIIIYPADEPWVVGSAFIFEYIYIFSLGWLEEPWLNKKK